MVNNNYFRGILALILLGLYIYAVTMAILVTNCLSQGAGCASYSKDSFTSGLAFTMATVGGIVSALAVVELSQTESGSLPKGTTINTNTPKTVNTANTALKIITNVYLAIWVIIGLLAFVIGFLQHPGVLQPLTDLGQAWLGLAAAAVYAYFGIKPTTTQ